MFSNYLGLGIALWYLACTWHGHSVHVDFLDERNESHYVSNFGGGHVFPLPPGRKDRLVEVTRDF